MSARVVLAPDMLVAAVGSASAADGSAARQALRGWVEDGAALLVAGPAWPALLDALRARGWSAARVVEAVHALDGLDLVTVEQDRPLLLLAADAMDRHDIGAAAAAAVVLAEIEGAALATLDPSVAAATRAEGAATDAPSRTARRPSGLRDYAAIGELLADLRRATDAAR